MKYLFRWGNNKWCPDGYPLAKYKNTQCDVLVFGKRNSCLVRFFDGFLSIVSRNSIKRLDK